MDNSKSDGQTALERAGEISAPGPTLIDRIVHFFTRQQPIRTGPKMVMRSLTGEIDPTAFQDTEEGSGAFGRWMIDENDLPCYHYDMNQRRDVRAYYINTEGKDRREHWHQIGNDSITGIASNDGVMQVYLANRGGVFLNRSNTSALERPTTLLGYVNALFTLLIQLYGRLQYAWIKFRSRNVINPRVVVMNVPNSRPENRGGIEEQLAFAGGYGYFYDGKDTWATAFRYAPNEAKTDRKFGIGYFETETTFQGIKQTRKVYAPYGEDPFLLADAVIENQRQTPVDLQYYEYWDVNVHQLQIEWIRTGLAAPLGNNRRFQINAHFDPKVTIEENPQALRFSQTFRTGATLDGVDRREVDTTPPNVFLANLNPKSASYYVDKATFFGNGNARYPEAISGQLPPNSQIPVLDGPMPYCLVMRHDIHLEPGESKSLRYGYGAAQPGQSLDFLNNYRHAEDSFKQTIGAWREQLPYFSTGSDPILQRETTWHGYNMLSATLYSEHFDKHYTPQGSSYLYLHGAEGVPRDQSLYTLPLVYIRPELARQMLTLLLSLRDANPDGLALPYGFVGNGAVVRDALHFHTNPSDLDLYILMAVSEYLSATGDMDFLDVKIPLYKFDGKTNPIAPITVLDHMRAAMKHLDQIGLGKHNLLTIGDGDWDDAIVIMNLLNPVQNLRLVDLQNTIKSGESVPNSQMALYVLPMAASVLEQHAPDLAAHMREKANGLDKAVQTQWDDNKQWFYRAYLIDPSGEQITIGDNHISLQSQVWPLITGLAAAMGKEEKLIETIKTKLDDPSPTGAMLEEKGQVWPAISQLVTWGYRRSRPDLAWRSLNRHTFAAHGTVFPNVWFNIWTGPDGTNSSRIPNPGGTWTSPVTPMTDFPAMNANQDAMALTGLLRVCGIEPSMKGDGLDITPAAPPERYVLVTRLLRLEVAPGRIGGKYHAVAKGKCTLHVHLPKDAMNITATLTGKPVKLGTEGALIVDLPLIFEPDQEIPFEVQWQEA